MQQVDGAVHGSCNVESSEETTNPGCENEEDDQNEKCRSDRIHDSLEMARISRTLDERSGLADEGATSGLGHDRVGLATFATGSVVANVTHVLVNGKRFTGDGRLIGGNN